MEGVSSLRVDGGGLYRRPTTTFSPGLPPPSFVLSAPPLPQFSLAIGSCSFHSGWGDPLGPAPRPWVRLPRRGAPALPLFHFASSRATAAARDRHQVRACALRPQRVRSFKSWPSKEGGSCCPGAFQPGDKRRPLTAAAECLISECLTRPPRSKAACGAESLGCGPKARWDLPKILPFGLRGRLHHVTVPDWARKALC